MSTVSSKPSTKETLIAARAILADPAHWTKNTFARDSHNKPVDPASPDAQCFCAVGTLRKVLDASPGDTLSTEKWNQLQDCVVSLSTSVAALTGQSLSVARFNDFSSTEHTDMLAVFDHAIANADS